jgi:hypothetical protein
MGEAARRTVYARYMPEDRSAGLVEILQDVVDRYGGPAAPAEQILREWASRMKDYAGEIQQDVLRREAQVESLRKALCDYEDQLTARAKEKSGRIAQRDRTIRAIALGRVGRLMAAVQRWWGKTAG